MGMAQRGRNGEIEEVRVRKEGRMRRKRSKKKDEKKKIMIKNLIIRLTKLMIMITIK